MIGVCHYRRARDRSVSGERPDGQPRAPRRERDRRDEMMAPFREATHSERSLRAVMRGQSAGFAGRRQRSA